MVFKSASDVPSHVLLERALSPPCSSHSIVLRPKKTKTKADKTSHALSEDEGATNSDANSSASSTLPRLKRRWSLFPMRRKSAQRQSKSISVISGPTLVDHQHLQPHQQPHDQGHHSLSRLFSRSNRNRQSLPPNQSLPGQTGPKMATSGNASSSLDGGGGGGGNEGDRGNKSKPEAEVVLLMSPEERVKLLAAQFSSPVLVNIDTSGRRFQRMSVGRRSLIHVRYQQSIKCFKLKINSNLLFFVFAFSVRLSHPSATCGHSRSVQVKVACQKHGNNDNGKRQQLFIATFKQ